MELKLYTTKDGQNVINKTLDNEIVLTIKIRNDFDILNPTIILSKKNDVDIGNFNYVHIPHFNKYYFIDNVEIINRGAVRLSMTIDVLETYKNDILNSECSFKRSLKEDDYLDGNFNFKVSKNISKYVSNKSIIKSSNYVLTCIGN